jgi:hypothetical protein
MRPASCDVRALLGAFVDGELPGVERLRVSTHLDTCEDCTRELDEITSVGGALRHAAAHRQAPELSGLAAGVVARVRAESAQSWRGLLDRAVQDWRWALVGAGSLAATFVSTLLVSAIVWEGPARQKDDSLAARMRNLGSNSGVMMVVARDQDGPLQAMMFDNGRPQASAPPFRPSTEVFLAKLADVMTRIGSNTNMAAASMAEADRLEAQALMDEIIGNGDAPRPAFGTLQVRELHLVTPVVTVKGL